MTDILKLHGKEILYTAFSNPTTIGEFNDVLTKKNRKEIILAHNAGLRMLEAFQSVHSNMHISNVNDLMKELEQIYNAYSYDCYVNKMRNETIL